MSLPLVKGLELDDLKGTFQLEPFYDPMINLQSDLFLYTYIISVNNWENYSTLLGCGQFKILSFSEKLTSWLLQKLHLILAHLARTLLCSYKCDFMQFVSLAMLFKIAT